MLFRVLGGLVLLGVTLAGRQPPDTASSGHAQPARFGAATAGVLVDVVVRDRRGRPVTDLSAEQFQVFEDGVPQTIVAFEPYSPDDRAASPGGALA